MERMEVLRLYDHHSDEVYRLAYSYLMNRDDAQDIVQEVFLRLLEKNHSIKTESEDAFLARITINCCKGKLLSTVSYRNFIRVLFLHIGHRSHSALSKSLSPYLCDF